MPWAEKHLHLLLSGPVAATQLWSASPGSAARNKKSQLTASVA